MIEFLRRFLKITDPLDRKGARACMILNLGAWPGLGSVLANRFVGWLQMLLSLSGLLAVIASLFKFMAMLWEETRYPNLRDSFVWMAIGGFATFAFAWVWALITSLSIRARAVPDVPRDLNRPPAL